jgi:WXG100 family type VII secretion target
MSASSVPTVGPQHRLVVAVTVTIPQVEASRPEALTQSATALGQKASGLATQIDKQRATLDGLRAGWSGTASDAAIAKAQPTLERMQQIHDALTRSQNVLQQGGSTLSQTRWIVMTTVAQLSGQGWQVAPDGTVSVRPGSPLDQFAKISTANAMKLQQLAATNSVNVKSLLAAFDTTDRQLSQNLRTAVGNLASGPMKLGPDGTPLPQGPSWDDGSQIPTAKDSKEVKKWWKSLDHQQRDKLLHDWPDKLGNLNGIPVVDRDTANRTVMQQDIDRLADVAAARGVTVEEVKAHPELYGMASGMMDRYNNAVQVQKGLQYNHDQTGAPTFLQVYEPDKFGGAGRAAIAIGDPDHADNTAVVVPGTSHSVTEGWLSQADAKNVYNETVAADRGKTNSVVAWMGYDAPDSMTDPQVGQTGLASDANALNDTHEGSSHVTVMGHSYGSTTVSDAAAGYGMHANDVVLIGCPGTDMANNAEDFNLAPGGHVYVGSASTDPVTQLGAIPQVHVPGTDVTVSLGADPAQDGFGSTRFKAEVPGFTNPISDHSQYLVPGSESLFSISDIASGHGDALEHDGMTADHRGTGLGGILNQFGVPVPDDPELYRAPTSGHYHK